jgi:Peptidase family M28
VSIQEVVVQESTYKNITARFGPEKGPLLVIGAHYDSYVDASLYSDRGDFITFVGAMKDFDLTRRIKARMMGASNLPVYSINAPGVLPGIDFSDHLSYWNAGIPAMMVTDTSFFRNKHYHLAGDTYDKLDYQRMAKVVQAVYSVTQGF